MFDSPKVISVFLLNDDLSGLSKFMRGIVKKVFIKNFIRATKKP